MRGFNTLRFETTPDGEGNAGLTPGGLPFEAPAEEAAPETPDYGEQMQQLQETITQQQQMLERLSPVADYLEGAPGPGQGQEQQGFLRPPDPFSENYAAEMENFLEQRDAQRFAPYQEMLQSQRLEELESSARDMISDVQSRNGELLAPQYEEGMKGLQPGDLILEVAKSYSPQMVNQYGEGVRADEAAIEAAYNDVKTLFDGLTAAHDARAENQMNALRQAPREPGSSGIAAQPAVTTQPGGWDAFKARHGIS